jgi:hypothetical protein
MGEPLTPAERRLRGQLAAEESWSRTADRSARTAPARAAFLDRFERQVDPDGSLPPTERALMAEHARRAHFLRLSLQSAKARRERAGRLVNGGDAA